MSVPVIVYFPSYRAQFNTYDHVDAVGAAGRAQTADPVRYERARSHRQQRLGGADQVSEPAAGVGSHVPLEPGPVPGGENYRLHWELRTGSALAAGFLAVQSRETRTRLGSVSSREISQVSETFGIIIFRRTAKSRLSAQCRCHPESKQLLLDLKRFRLDFPQ